MLTMPLHRQIKTESLALVADNRSLTPGDKEVGELLGIIEDKIMQDIAERRLQISPSKKDYLSELQKEQLEDKRISKLRDLKNNIKQKLEEIVREQKVLKLEKVVRGRYNMRLDRKPRLADQVRQEDCEEEVAQQQQKNFLMKPKSQLTQEDQVKLKILKQRYLEFEMQLKQKTDEYNEFLERMKSQERDLEVREKQQLSQKHREDILKKKADIVEKKQQMQKQFVKDKLRIKWIQSKPRLYNSLSQQYSKMEQQERQQKHEQMLRQLQARKDNGSVQVIKEHQKHYLEALVEMKKQRKQKMLQINRTALEVSKKYESTKSKSRHYLQLQKLLEDNRRREEEKSQEKYLKVKRIKEYVQKVEKEIPKAPVTDRPERASSSDVSARKQYTKEEMKSIGNNYLKASIRKAAKKKPRTCSETSNPESSIKRYTNYIPDLRQQREQHGNNLGDLFAREINSIKKIMQSPQDYRDKLLKVKYITNKIEESPVFDKESYLLDKIAIKLKILDMTRGLETTE